MKAPAKRAIFDGPRSVMNDETQMPEYQSPAGHTVAFVRLEYGGLFTLLVLAIVWGEHLGLI